MKHRRRNTPLLTALAYFTLIAGILLFSIGMYRADLQVNEKGYYIAVMLLIIVGAIFTQKIARDNAEDNEILSEQNRSN
jgi:uncharacterized membrane protein YiaA